MRSLISTSHDEVQLSKFGKLPVTQCCECHSLSSLYWEGYVVIAPHTITGFLFLQVVSLVNLTLQEMKEALQQFCRLLVEDTYAVFYFAGHGFECSGHSYLMPVDATDRYHHHENMASSDVLKAMQETKAKLSVVLLDCCRSV